MAAIIGDVAFGLKRIESGQIGKLFIRYECMEESYGVSYPYATIRRDEEEMWELYEVPYGIQRYGSMAGLLSYLESKSEDIKQVEYR